MKISYMSLSKILISLYVLYNSALTNIGFYVPYLSIILLGGAFGCLCMSHKMVLPGQISYAWKALVVFFIIAAITGFLFASHRDYVSTQVKFLLESLFAGYIIVLLSEETEDVDFLSMSLMVGAILITLYFLTGNAVDTGHGRYSIADDINTNTLGVYLMFGNWALLKVCSRIKSLVVMAMSSLIGTAVILLVVIQTGSRKSIIGICFILVIWVIFCLRQMLVGVRFSYKVLFYAVFAITILFIVIRYGGVFISVSDTLQYRMSVLADSDGSWTVRLELIVDAFKVFLRNFMFGVGLNNYRFYSSVGLYSHNTFVEVLACTGILGGIPFYSALLYIIKSGLTSLKRKIKLKENLTNESFFMSLLLVFLFVCNVQICIYNQNLMFILYLLIGYASIFNNERMEEKIIDAFQM